MMSRAEAMEQYRLALKRGQKYYKECLSDGVYPYPQVLAEIFDEAMSAARVSLGVIEIPTARIVGTLAAGRRASFAGNFMPLLPPESEFGMKWVSLCQHHLEEGISDPISCYEYMGRFYVQEGHKRVSVLRSYDALTVQANVTRLMPAWSEEPAVAAYFEFLDFYRVAGFYQLLYRRPGCYKRILDALGFDHDHVWTAQERSEFLALYWKLREVCGESILSSSPEHSLSMVMLTVLEVYPYRQLVEDSAAELRRHVEAILPDLRLTADPDIAAVSEDPEIPEKGIVGRLIDNITHPTLHVAFVHAAPPENSNWTRGHELGRTQLEQALGDQISVRSYVAGPGQADEVMERAVTEDGAQLLIATAPTLLGSARTTAALHPGLMVLVCALSVPYAGVRTYYSRIHEAKFISGAIAGAMCGGKPIGYVARYPILGVPAAINAFALGARMTAPEAQILLEWSCLPGDPTEKLRQAGCSVISGHPTAQGQVGPMGRQTSLLLPDGAFRPLIDDLWDWGKLYEQIVRGVLGGAWDTVATSGGAVSYWWGMRSGVIDVKCAPDLPEGVTQLSEILRSGLIAGTLQPFLCPMQDQAGRQRSDGSRWLDAEEIMHMNWLCSNISGRIPRLEELLPMSQETTRLLAIPPEETEADA